MSKPRVLVLGGVGFVGRNFVKYLVENNLCSKIRVVDKALPATAYFNKATEAAFNNPVVEYKQGNLANPTTVAKVFADDGKWTYVFNLAAETRFSQTEEIYKEKVLDLSVHCAKEAAKLGVTKYVEVSTAQVYKSEKKASGEDDKTKPWTTLAKYKLKAEEALKAIPGLPLVIVRPAIVYGPGDVSGLAPRIICGAVYTELKEEMKFLWSGDLRLNTVHVHDVCRALWFLAEKGTAGQVYNLADKNDTDQKKVNDILESIFKIKTSFAGSALSQMAKLSLSSVTESVNDKHLKPWSDLCKKQGISNTPLTPYLDEELLSDNHLAVDGSKIESLGFKYEHPHCTESLLRESITYYEEQGLFPKIKST
jgi:nucleoside-diphosphate-sugar epimerase